MDIERFLPKNVKELIYMGDAYKIYRTIQYSADLGLKELQKTEKQCDFDPELASEIRSSVKDALKQASELRFFLKTVNNKIQRDQRLKRALQEHTDADVNNIAVLFDMCLNILTDEIEKCERRIVSIVWSLKHEIDLSLGFRIQLIGCWDEILACHQEIIAEQIVHLSHRLSEIAILLQDNEAIAKVRNILDSLNITVSKPAKVHFSESTEELREILKSGIETIETAAANIDRLDEQRQTLREIQGELSQKVVPDETQKPPPTNPSPKKPTKKRKSATRMTFRRKDEE